MSAGKLERIVSYITPKIATEFRKEAARMGFTESAYVRFLILKELRSLKGR